MTKYKKVIKNSKFKISVPTWNEKFELLDGSYSVSNIQDYFKHITKKHEIVTDNLPIRIYVNQIKNKITFRIKTKYYLEPLMPGMMSTISKTAKDENGENVPRLGITEVVLVHYHIVNNDYHRDSRALYKFVFSKQYGQLLNISP